MRNICVCYYWNVFLESLCIILLPNSLHRFYNCVAMILFRFLGGICVILYMLKFHIYLNGYLYYFIVYITFYHICLVLLISITKVVYVILSFKVLNNNVTDNIYIIYTVVYTRIILLVVLECIGFIGIGTIEFILDFIINLHDTNKIFKRFKDEFK